jgi:hypothetical protein
LWNALFHWLFLFAHRLSAEQYNVVFTQFICRWQLFAVGLLIGHLIKGSYGIDVILLHDGLVKDDQYVLRLQISHCLVKKSECKNSVLIDSLLFLDHNQAEVNSRVLGNLRVKTVDPMTRCNICVTKPW